MKVSSKVELTEEEIQFLMGLIRNTGMAYHFPELLKKLQLSKEEIESFRDFHSGLS